MKHFITLLCGSSLCLLFGCMQQDQQMMKQMEANKKVAKDFWEAFLNQHDAAKAASYFADNGVQVDYTYPKADTGRAQIQEHQQIFVTAFPDGHVSFEGETAHGEMVALQWHAMGTNTGPLMGMPATNKRAETHGCDVFHIVNGKIVHRWSYWDMAGFMKQLGMMPEPGAASAETKKDMRKK